MQAAWFPGFLFCVALFARIANMYLGCFRHLFFGKNIFSMGTLIPAVPEMLLPLTGWGRIDFNPNPHWCDHIWLSLFQS
jgi:hypothetical protein